ncbi:LOW QUALITY PROTEIN: microtubule-actin cross-linking factor 1, isoforms 6/7-like, partial [Pleuronectes platessa]|uniref:LOW QUALITY PROTEIN: microtubule-actin cross-linking factor 1, isoforms 6/7-like n=1 Tax=Pleuronectes platessa TaxID=8262 RepID=UPI00232A2260
MGKPLSRPDCLRQNPRCLGKGDEDEAYIEDCYVPQRSIYDTMRINEQIDQGAKLCQPSRSTLGSGGEGRGEGSTLSSNGTIGTDIGGVFVSRSVENAGGVKKLDERVIFDALKLTGDLQIMSPPVGIVGSGLPIAPPSSASGGVAAVVKRRHQGGDKKDNPNRRSWKAFMPPSYPEFAERLEFSSVEGSENRSSSAGIPLSPLQPIPFHLPPSTPTSSTPSLPPYTPSPLSSAPHTPPVSSSPALTPTVSPVPPLQQHPLSRQRQVHPLLQKQHKHTHVVLSPSKEQLPALRQNQSPQVSRNTPEHSPSISKPVERRVQQHRRTTSSSKAVIRQIPEEPLELVKTSDSERDSPLLDQDLGDSAPLLPPKPVFCPPTKARTWPRSMTTGKRAQLGLRHNFPVLPPLPPLLSEESNTDEESLYLLDPPSPFLKEEEGLVYGGLPLSPLWFGGPGAPSASPCPSSAAESDDLFLELERQCLEDEGEEGVEMSVDPEPVDPYTLPCVEEEEKEEEGETVWVDFQATLPLVNAQEPDSLASDFQDDAKDTDLIHFEHLEDIGNFDLMRAQDCEKEHGLIDEDCDVDFTEDKAEVEEEEMSYPTDSALGQQVESDSSGVHMSQPDRTGISDITQTDCEHGKPAQTETDPDSGASSERDVEDCGERAASPSRCPLNPYAEELEQVEEETEQDEGETKEEEELGTEWDVYDQSEPSLDGSEGVLMDQSHEPLLTVEKETDSECTKDVDVQTSCQDDPVPSEISEPAMETTCDTEGTSFSSETQNVAVPTNVFSEMDIPEKDSHLSTEVRTSSPNSDCAPPLVPQETDSAPPSSLPQSPSKSDSCGAGLDSKDSEAFVISDSFVYLAVSAPPQYPNDCPPSPLVDSIPPSPVPKPPCCPDPEDEEGHFLSPDSFVYMAAPERPQPGPSDVGSACEDTQELDMDSYSEGTQSGMDGLGVGRLRSGLSSAHVKGPGLGPTRTRPATESVTLPETNQGPAHRPQEEEPQTGATAWHTDPLLESARSSEAEDESTDILPFCDDDAQAEAVEREQVDSIQPKLQHVNAVGQGLIQSAAKHTDTQALEHDLETTNLRWNSFNKRVAERIAQLQEALLHCGKFQDALEPLLSWLSDTEELVANQKPPSAEYRVVKAQIQEQKLLQRLLDDRRPTVEMIRAEGERIAATADTQDQEKIQTQLHELAERWTELLDKASARQRQLEELQVLALHFHEALEPLGEWLSATERRLSSAEPMGTQTAKISQQITKHKAIQEDVSLREAEVDHLESLSQSLTPLSCAADRDWLNERVGAVRSGHSELTDWSSRRAGLLEQALANAQLFGEDEVEVLNWLAEVAQRLGQVSVQNYQPQLLAEQHKHTLSLNEEIVSRKKTVDQAVKNGQALLKQTTGEEVLLIQEKLDGIKSRYAEMTAGSSKALRTLEQALQLATRFASAHEDISQWLDGVEAELNNVEPDASPAYQERQKELKKVSAEKRLVLDTVNEVGGALLDLVPWRAREGLDRLVADGNQRYRQADETITQRVKLVQAAIQRSQQYEEAVDAERAWVGETERKLASLGPLSLEPDVTVAQLQVQRAFNIDIIRHKDTVDQLLSTREEILETCSEAQKEALMVKTDSLSARYEAVSHNHGERFSALEQAQVLVARFWETYEELEPWLGETETLISQLPPPAIDSDALRLQQDQMRLLRESIAEHKPHIDKLLKIGPRLAELSLQEGATLTQRYTRSERRYLAIKEEVKGRATALDEAVSQSAQLVEFHDKMDPLLETLEGAVQRLRSPPPVAAEVDKIREQLAEHRAQGLELDKLLPSFSALCARGEELIGRAARDDPAAQAVRSRLLRLRSLWDEIRQRAEEREGKLNDVLDVAGKFWSDVAALLSTLRDSQDIVRELEDPGVDPSLIKQQVEAAEAIKAETDGLREELEFVRTLGADLIFACGETEKPEVKKTIDEMNAAWEGLDRTWRERMERLDEAMTASVQYQDALQSMFDYLDNAVIKLCDMSTVGTEQGTVKQQIEELKIYKVEVYQQQIDMEKLCHQGELMLKKVSDQTDRDMIQEPLTELRHLWENLGDKINQRQHKLEAALLALGQFQHALSELQGWLSHTHTTLDSQRPVSSDPKAIEIELAKHHVLRNDVLSHHATVETVTGAAAELLESSPGDEASHLRDQLEQLNQSWENLLLRTQERQKLLEAALHQAEGFHGELEEFLQWLRRTESQLSAAKPTGGLPETAREQLQQHMELQAQLAPRGDQYHRLLDQGESMLLARGGEEAALGATQTQQNLGMLQNKWASLNTKMEDRKAKLEEAVSLATGFQTSLQDTIIWLTQAEQTLNMAQPPSLILDTVLFQIDEHKVFVNEVNTHREQVLALEKAGSQLRFASLKQDVVLIKNLLLSVQARWDKLVQRSLDRGRHLDEARKRAKQFHEAWRKLTDWLEEAEKRLDSELEISNEPDKIKIQLTKHKEFQKALGSKQPVYDTTVRSGRAMRDKAQLPADTQRLDHLVGEVRDKWDTVCGKSVERQHKLEEALLFSGQFAEALQALVDWLYRVEPQLAEDQPVHGDLDLVSNLMDSHKSFQKELGKRTGSIQALRRSARDLMETGRDDTAWVKVQLQELSNRWDTVCALSVTKQTRLQQGLKQAEEFRTAVQVLLEWLSEAEQTLRFRGVLPEEAETLQALLHTHRDFMGTVEERRGGVNKAAGMGESILTLCHPDSITTIKHWITIIRARFEEVLTWAKQHEQRLETALTEVLSNANLLEELLSWLQWAETTLVQRDADSLPQDITQLKSLITEHQTFMEEMTMKQPDVDKVTKTYKRKPAEPHSSLSERRGARKQQQQQQQQAAMQVPGGNPRLNQLCARWQQVWLLALDRQRKLNDALDRLEELKEFANFDFDVWRKKY